MPVILHIDELSQPSRACIMLCYMANIPLELDIVNVVSGDHQTPEFAKKNPNRKIPVMTDGDVVLFESAAIMRYLCNKYLPEDNEFYPRNDPIMKAKIEQMIDYHHRFVRPGARASYALTLAIFQGLTEHFIPEIELAAGTRIAGLVDGVLKERGAMVT